MNIMLTDAVKILTEGTNDSYSKVQLILEDSTSPVTKNYKERLFQSVMSKSHIDFGDIPKSRGDVTKYSGYKSMTEVLSVLLKIAGEEKSTELKESVNTILTSIENIKGLKSIFMKGFANKVDLAIMDYNTYVLTCVEATTSLMYSYIDFIKTPSSPNYVLNLKNTKYRADALYIEQLEKFNRVNNDGNYTKYLSTLVNKGQENMLLDGAVLVGAAVVSFVALSIIPVTRELVYLYNESKRKLSDLFALQAYFLELNKTTLEYNSTIKPEKKKKIIEKQEKVRKKFLYLSEKLRITNIKAEDMARKKLDIDNKGMSVGDIEKDVSDSDISVM